MVEAGAFGKRRLGLAKTILFRPSPSITLRDFTSGIEEGLSRLPGKTLPGKAVVNATNV
jgi:hypothetical protein